MDNREKQLFVCRISAWLIEFSIVNLTLTPIVLSFFLYHKIGNGSTSTESYSIFKLLSIDTVWLLSASWLPYLIFRDAFGRSWGKRIFGLKLLNSSCSGRPRTAGLVLRNLVFSIPLFFLLEFFVFAFSRNRMPRLGDFIGGTRVVGDESLIERRWVLFLPTVVFWIISGNLLSLITMQWYKLITFV